MCPERPGDLRSNPEASSIWAARDDGDRPAHRRGVRRGPTGVRLYDATTRPCKVTGLGPKVFKIIATRVWVIDQGTIAEDGPPKQVVDEPKTEVAREYFARQRK
jgi:hypothetical protein